MIGIFVLIIKVFVVFLSFMVWMVLEFGLININLVVLIVFMNLGFLDRNL